MTTEHLRFLKKFRRRRRMVVFLRILILFLFLLQWEICADTGVVDSFIFSSAIVIISWSSLTASLISAIVCA